MIPVIKCGTNGYNLEGGVSAAPTVAGCRNEQVSGLSEHDGLHHYQPEFDPERSGAIAAGVDLIEIARIRQALDDFGQRFLRRVYTEREREAYGQRISELAARFAAKEATSKVLGTGLRGIRWREMEILANRRGKPVLVLHGGAAARAAALGLVDFSVSLTHSRTEAMAFVVGIRQAPQQAMPLTHDQDQQAIQGGMIE